MKNWVMLNMHCLPQVTLFNKHCLHDGMYMKETTLSHFDCIKIKPK